MSKVNYPIVKYANELNNLDFSSFNLIDKRFFFSFLSQCKNKPIGAKIILSRKELLSLGIYPKKVHKSVDEFIKDLDRVTKKCYSLFFRKPLLTKDKILIRNIRIFEEIAYEFDRRDPGNLNKIRVYFVLHPEAEEFLHKFFNYTSFPLPEFQGLKSSYSQNLFLQLKQFMSTGDYFVNQEELKSILNIPSKYRQHDIDRRVLKPAVEELQSYFPNLNYVKLKNGKDKRKVSTYHFFWDKDPNQVSHKSNVSKNLKLLKNGKLPEWAEIESFITEKNLNIDVNEAIEVLAKKIRNETISNWKNYLKGVSDKKVKSGRETSKMPEWYEEEPSKKQTPELLLKARLLNYTSKGEDPKKHLEELAKSTKIPSSKILFYINNPDRLNEAIDLAILEES